MADDQKTIDTQRIKDMAATVKASSEDLSSVSAKQTAEILRAGFAELSAKIDACAADAAVRVPGFGVFRVTEGTRKSGEAFRRVTFRPASGGDSE